MRNPYGGYVEGWKKERLSVFRGKRARTAHKKPWEYKKGGDEVRRLNYC